MSDLLLYGLSMYVVVYISLKNISNCEGCTDVCPLGYRSSA